MRPRLPWTARGAAAAAAGAAARGADVPPGRGAGAGAARALQRGFEARGHVGEIVVGGGGSGRRGRCGLWGRARRFDDGSRARRGRRRHRSRCTGSAGRTLSSAARPARASEARERGFAAAGWESGAEGGACSGCSDQAWHPRAGRPGGGAVRALCGFRLQSARRRRRRRDCARQRSAAGEVRCDALSRAFWPLTILASTTMSVGPPIMSRCSTLSRRMRTSLLPAIHGAGFDHRQSAARDRAHPDRSKRRIRIGGSARR